VKTAVLLDVDNTITPPRQPLNQQMAIVLECLNVPFYIVAGSHIGLLREQFFDPLYKFGFRKRFDAFISNGAMLYRCDYSKKQSIRLVSKFSLRKHLGKKSYDFLTRVLRTTMELAQFKLPDSVAVDRETIIVDRESMVNLSPMGRRVTEDLEGQQNRDAFVKFDETTGYRQRMMDYLKHELSPLISGRQLTITLGGQTSLDIGVEGEDKTKAVRTLLDAGTERIIFIGDALFEGGNDAVIQQLVDNWPPSSTCPLSTISVNSWEETKIRLFELGLIDE
jgi:hydroxymethylpyrimidine pyrophosphatase-like HAD family hydrolase